MTTTEDRYKRRELVLAFIRVYMFQHNYAPSYREIAAGLDISSVCIVGRDLDVLEAQGRITRKPFMARSIRIVGIDNSLDKAA